MPVCQSCNMNNSLESKACQNCGQALIMYDEKICSYCTAINGIYAKKCQKCDSPFHHVTIDRAPKSITVYELLKKSYLYDEERETFAELQFSIKEMQDKIHFKLGEDNYIFNDPDDLRNIFNAKEHPIPDFILENAPRFIKPIFEKYSRALRIELLADNFERTDPEILYAVVNEKGQIVTCKKLDIFEQDVKNRVDKLVDSCTRSSSYLNFERNIVHHALLSTMDDFDYRYEIISQNKEEYVYKLGENNLITVHCGTDKDILKITYLNGKLRLTSEDLPYLSIILLNWMIDINIVSVTMKERMHRLIDSSTRTLKTIKKLSNRKYSLTDNKDLTMQILSENIIQFTFQRLSNKLTQAVHPNMSYDEFEKLLENMIDFSANKTILEYIKKIEDATHHALEITDITDSNCKLIIYTKNVTVTSIVLNDETTYDEVLKYINKIMFLENIIKN